MPIIKGSLEELNSPLYISQMIHELQVCLREGRGDSFTEAGLIYYWKEWKAFWKTYDKNSVPEIIDLLGSNWRQPSSKNMAIDDEYAIIDDCDWRKLATYSTSRPSGVYAGKMWKRKCPDRSFILCWYGYDEKPNLCSINERYILAL